MKKARFAETQIVSILKQQEAGILIRYAEKSDWIYKGWGRIEK